MAKHILIDELHVTLLAPSGLTAKQSHAARRALRRASFLPALTRAARAVVRRYPSLRAVRVTVSR
jgi:hypothetical protein